jgi:predicted nucleotidyltransferase
VAHRLEPYLQALVEKISPKKIILFGSYAYGTPNEHSDFDLLVIREGIESESDSSVEIRNVLAEVSAPSIPFTILSKTPERIAEGLSSGSAFYGEMVGKGVVVYDSAWEN